VKVRALWPELADDVTPIDARPVEQVLALQGSIDVPVTQEGDVGDSHGMDDTVPSPLYLV